MDRPDDPIFKNSTISFPLKKEQNITYFEKVSDLYKALDLPIEQEEDFTIDSILDIHQSSSYKSPVFRTNYYSFVFVKEGRGNYTTDEQNFEYTSRTIYFTNPGHLKAFEFYDLAEAYLITLSEAFLKTNVHNDIFAEFPFLLAETIPPQTLPEKKFAEFERLYLQILDEYKGSSKFKYRIIGNLFVALLLKIKEQFWSNYYPLEEGSRSSEIVKKFKQSLEKHYRELAEGKAQYLFQAQDYARLQNLNPNYLSQVISSKTGKSISSWISEKTVAQAKALLKHSDLSIKEVGFQLGYTELSNFSSFFKKHSGLSPSVYRKEFKN